MRAVWDAFVHMVPFAKWMFMAYSVAGAFFLWVDMWAGWVCLAVGFILLAYGWFLQYRLIQRFRSIAEQYQRLP